MCYYVFLLGDKWSKSVFSASNSDYFRQQVNATQDAKELRMRED